MVQITRPKRTNWEEMFNLLAGVLTLFLFCAAVARGAFAQTTIKDPCAPGQPRDPNLWCPDSAPGTNTVGNPGGIVAVSSYSSCSALEKESGVVLECGKTKDASQMTVLDVSITPGSKNIVRFRANIVRTPPQSGSATTDFPGTDGTCFNINGQCSTMEEVVIEIETSDSSVVYQLQPTNLEIPYMVAAFHSNAFGAQASKGRAKECGTYSDDGTEPYIDNPERSEFDDRGSNNFTRLAVGVVAFNNLITPPVAPNFETPKSWTILLSQYIFYGTSFVTPLSVSKNAFARRINGNPLFSGFTYSATNPGFNPNDNYGMKPSARPGADGILLLPPSPFMTQDPFDIYDGQINFGIRSLADGFVYEGPAVSRNNAEQNAYTKGMWLSMLRKYSGALSNLAPARLWAGTYFYTGMKAAKKQWYRWTSVDKSLIRPEALNPDDPETRFVADIRPVCIGCGWGPFFPSNDILQPVPAKNGGLWEKGDPWPFPNAMTNPEGDRRPGEEVTCSSDDEDCVGSATSLFTSNRFRQTEPSTTPNNAASPSVPMVKCSPIDYKTIENGQTLYCNEDRIGCWEVEFPPIPAWAVSFASLLNFGITQIWETVNGIFVLAGNALGFTNSQYITADTFGTVGEPCQVLQIQPQALPQYAIAVRMYNKAGKLLDSVRLSNIPDSSQWANPASTNGDNSEAPGDAFNGTNGETLVVGAGQQLFAELTGYDTLNGKIAPDLYGNIVVCNLTKNQQGLYQSATDPTFGTPINPWVYANNEECAPGVPYNATNRCEFMYPELCTTSGKVPLPQCLAARPRRPNEEYNPYAWWYYQDPRRATRINEAFGSSAMPSSRFAEKEIKDQVCRSPRYAGVPGWIPGFDWTLEDRLRDQLNTTQSVPSITGQVYRGPNAQERALRDKLPAHTACHVVGYFNDWQKERGCQNFLNQAAYQRYLPPNFVVPKGGSTSNLQEQTCSLPQYAVDGTRLLYFGNTQSNTQSNVRLRVGISGTLVRVENSVSGGTFDQSSAKPNTCSTLRGGSGEAQLLVRNTGTVRGTYLITSKCTNGVRQLGDYVFSMEPSANAQLISVPMAQSSSTQVPSPAICTFNLTHPQYRTQIFFSQLESLPCSLLLVSSNSQSAGAGAWQQEANLTAVCTPDEDGTVPSFCQPPKINQRAFEVNGIATGLVYYFGAVIAVFISVFFCTLNIMSMKLSN